MEEKFLNTLVKQIINNTNLSYSEKFTGLHSLAKSFS